MDWNKLPAATTGGKAWFYSVRTAGGMRWVVWDRVERTWTVQADGMIVDGSARYPHILARVPSAAAGRRFVEADGR